MFGWYASSANRTALSGRHASILHHRHFHEAAPKAVLIPLSIHVISMFAAPHYTLLLCG
jgi:hypothetical protein